MEGLKKLERVQTAIKFMDSHGILDSDEVSNPDSALFLANLILLMIQPCGKLDMDVKSKLLVISLSKMPVALLEEASIVLAETGDEDIENVVLSHPDENAVSCSLQNDTERISMIGLDAMLRANSTLEDFCRSYFMFHDMEASNVQSLFKYLPLLSFTESYIYQATMLFDLDKNNWAVDRRESLDNLNEDLLQMPSSRNPSLEKQNISEENWSWMRKCTEMCNTNPFRPLALLLERRGLLTERINKEFKCGQQYWTAERKLCYALVNKLEISIEDVMRAIHLKSFDYRVLNLLLYQLRGQKDDVIENSFNILRMFVRIYGASAAPSMLAKIITEAEEKYILLLKALGPELSSKYQRRCEEATCEGGKKSGPPLGTWNIPPVIEDEDLYRSRHSN